MERGAVDFFVQHGRPCLFKMVLSCCIGSFFLTAPIQAKTPYFNQRHNFSLTLPAAHTIHTSELPQVALLVRTTEEELPSFNIIVEPGPFPLEKSPSELHQRLLRSYNQVGLQDIRILYYEHKTILGAGAFLAKLQYNHGGEEIIATVGFFSRAHEHFILTYLEPANGSPSAALNVINSFTAEGLLPLPPLEPGPSALPLGLTLLFLVSIGAGGALFYWQRTRSLSRVTVHTHFSGIRLIPEKCVC
jgi:hypothetical protein